MGDRVNRNLFLFNVRSVNGANPSFFTGGSAGGGSRYQPFTPLVRMFGAY
jgi:hypothetical protein